MAINTPANKIDFSNEAIQKRKEEAFQRTMKNFRMAGEQSDRDFENIMAAYGKTVMAIIIGGSSLFLTTRALDNLDNIPEIREQVSKIIQIVQKK